jgi:hypothetical protein
MQSSQPNFYLVSGERSDPQTPTACWAERRLRDSRRDDYMLVHIRPAIIGQKYGLGGSEIDRLVLSARLTGNTLYPIKEWPCHVYVMRILNGRILNSLSLDEGDVEMISWGTLHRTLDDAARALGERGPGK